MEIWAQYIVHDPSLCQFRPDWCIGPERKADWPSDLTPLLLKDHWPWLDPIVIPASEGWRRIVTGRKLFIIEATADPDIWLWWFVYSPLWYCCYLLPIVCWRCTLLPVILVWQLTDTQLPHWLTRWPQLLVIVHYWEALLVNLLLWFLLLCDIVFVVVDRIVTTIGIEGLLMIIDERSPG